jgi:integrase
MYAVLRAALEQAVREDLVVRNVAKLVRVPAAAPPEVQPYDPDEARQLLAAAEADRLYAMWAVALSLGLRKGESLGLRWADVDLDEGWLRVRQTVQRVQGELRFMEPKMASPGGRFRSRPCASRPFGSTGSARPPSASGSGTCGGTSTWCSAPRSGRRSTPTT